MARRLLVVAAASLLVVVLAAGPALACGGLVSPNGTIALVRTTTLAAYHDGVEHYVTGFEFVGGGAEFGSIVPLPGVPSRVIRGGDWTLQRLEREVAPPAKGVALDAASAPAPSPSAQVLLQKSIDSLDITILKGGGYAVGTWAKDHGFQLTPDAPEVLDFYASRSPIFMAVQFNAKRAQARGESIGDAIPIHLVIPTKRPWVPLRILALGAKGLQPIEADVFLLTDRRPDLLPAPEGSGDLSPIATGLRLERSEPASLQLLTDLRSDRGMDWLPRSDMWLTFLQLDAKAHDLRYDLAIDPSGRNRPSPIDAGLTATDRVLPTPGGSLFGLWLAIGLMAALLDLAWVQRRRVRPVA
ncbi:MAG: DUF2330 domain-containing protein [Actinomycetota bacterium]|nr:DUF2330 domain-containing protein [Actinomycetota bacterium]